MARIAQEDTFVEDADGIRRLVAKGSPIPIGMEVEAKTEEANTRDLSRVVVDEEASKSHAERTGVEPSKAGTRNAVAELRSKSSRSSASKSEKG